MMLSQHYYSAQNESSIILADGHDCLYGDLYDVLLEAFEEDDNDVATMAPGCVSKKQQDAAELPPTYGDKARLQSSNNEDQLEINLDQIPLPSTPPPPPPFEVPSNGESSSSGNSNNEEKSQPTTLAALAALTPAITSAPLPKLKPIVASFVYDTLDSFEILEQTVRKQKRLSRKKNTDMRMKVLLKRTFDLICEIMDHENGFDDDDEAVFAGEKINLVKSTSTSPPPPPPPLPSDDLLFKDSSAPSVLEINVKHNDYAEELIAAEASSGSGNVSSSSDSSTNVVPSSYEIIGKRKRDDDEDESEEDSEDEDDENRAAPTDCRASKRQKFTCENDNNNNNSNSNNTWCKEENESMFDECHCEGDVTFHNLTNCNGKRRQQNSVYYDNNDHHNHHMTTFKKEIQANSEL